MLPANGECFQECPDAFSGLDRIVGGFATRHHLPDSLILAALQPDTYDASRQSSFVDGRMLEASNDDLPIKKVRVSAF